MAAAPADAPAPKEGLDRVASSTGFNLNLAGVDGGMVAGEQSLEAGEFLMSARATNEVPLTVRGAAKARAQQLCALTPAMLGSSRVKAAWRPGGALIAVVSEKDDGLLVQTFGRDGKQVESHTLGSGKPIWCDWDSSGSSLAIMQENVGLFLWDVAGPDTLPGAPASPALLRSAPDSIRKPRLEPCTLKSLSMKILAWSRCRCRTSQLHISFSFFTFTMSSFSRHSG